MPLRHVYLCAKGAHTLIVMQHEREMRVHRLVRLTILAEGLKNIYLTISVRVACILGHEPHSREVAFRGICAEPHLHLAILKRVKAL